MLLLHAAVVQQFCWLLMAVTVACFFNCLRFLFRELSVQLWHFNSRVSYLHFRAGISLCCFYDVMVFAGAAGDRM